MLALRGRDIRPRPRSSLLSVLSRGLQLHAAVQRLLPVCAVLTRENHDRSRRRVRQRRSVQQAQTLRERIHSLLLRTRQHLPLPRGPRLPRPEVAGPHPAQRSHERGSVRRSKDLFVCQLGNKTSLFLSFSPFGCVLFGIRVDKLFKGRNGETCGNDPFGKGKNTCTDNKASLFWLQGLLAAREGLLETVKRKLGIKQSHTELHRNASYR
mgnify:CR=1 FL=1